MLDFLSSSFLGESVSKFVHETGFAQLFLQEGGYKYLIMIAVGCFFLYLAIKHKFEPMLLVPIGFGIIIGNIPMVTGHGIGIYEEGSVLNYLYFGVRYGVYPPLIFLGVGAMTDFSSLISNPKLMLIGAAAQIGIFAAYMGALALGFPANEAGSIAIIGGADGPTAIFLTSRLAPEYMGAIAICAYSYMALVPVIQPPVMRLLTSSRERLIKMRPPRAVSSTEKILFPIIGFLLTTFVVPDAIPLLGMLFLGNLLKESGVVKRLATTASNQLIDIMTILIGITVGASTQASVFLTPKTLGIFVLHRHDGRRAVRQVDEPLPEGGQQDQPADRQCWRFGRSGRRARVAGYGYPLRPFELPADARHGSQCGRCGRVGSRRRYSALVPRIGDFDIDRDGFGAVRCKRGFRVAEALFSCDKAESEFRCSWPEFSV